MPYNNPPFLKFLPMTTTSHDKLYSGSSKLLNGKSKKQFLSLFTVLSRKINLSIPPETQSILLFGSYLGLLDKLQCRGTSVCFQVNFFYLMMAPECEYTKRQICAGWVWQCCRLYWKNQCLHLSVLRLFPSRC